MRRDARENPKSRTAIASQRRQSLRARFKVKLPKNDCSGPKTTIARSRAASIDSSGLRGQIHYKKLCIPYAKKMSKKCGLTAPVGALEEWMAREAIGFSLEPPQSLEAAVDRVVAGLGDSVELLGFGEALHGAEEILVLRNRLFQRLVAAHGYRAIAVESSFPRGWLVNEYVAGRGPASYDEVREAGFGHGFGRLEANRELVEWMRHHNASRGERDQVRFYGFDIPGLESGPASPRQTIRFVLDYLRSIDAGCVEERGRRIESLMGEDAAWENLAAIIDPTKAVGLTVDAAALRIEVDELGRELRMRRPEARGGRRRRALCGRAALRGSGGRPVSVSRGDCAEGAASGAAGDSRRIDGGQSCGNR